MHEQELGELRVHMSNVAHALLIGRTLAQKYAIEKLIAAGGMGAVYRARQIALDKCVAVKVLHREVAGEPKFVARFQQEALSASRLDHPNSLRVLDFGEDHGLLYLVMEYVAAEDLLSLLQRAWPLESERIVSIVSQILAALGVAHELGIVHRDIKPENILVTLAEDDDGLPVDQIKVCDFGVAKMSPRPTVHADSFAPRLTVDGLAVGTPDYMSPEQARGEAVDGRSDLYAVGVVLYHLLAGRTPFVGDSALAVALQHVTDEPPPPSRYGNVHPGLEAVCLQAMSKRPADRFQTAREMRRALRAALEGTRPSSFSTPPLVFTQPGPGTPRFRSSSPAEPVAVAPRPVPRRRRGLGIRLRQTAVASAGGALLAVGIAATPTLAQHTIEPLVAKRYQLAKRFQLGEPAPTTSRWNPERADVRISGVRTSSGVSEGCVRAALERAPLAACYRRALRVRNAPVRLEAALQLDVDSSGRVMRSELSHDGALPGLRSCIESDVIGADVCNTDGTDGTASVELTFVP